MKKECVLITGATTGLGKALAYVFGGKKHTIVLHGEILKDVITMKKQMMSSHMNCIGVAGDLREDETIEKLGKLSRKHDVSVLINNAGLHCPHLPLEKIDSRLIDALIMTNLLAPIKLTKTVYKHFIERGSGVVININSLSGKKNQELRSVYSASKWGLRGFSDTFRVEAKTHQVRILDVYPRRIKTKPEFRVGLEPEDAAQKIYDTFLNTDIEQIDLTGR